MNEQTQTAAEQLANLQQQQVGFSAQVVATTRQLKTLNDNYDAVSNAIVGVELGMKLAAEQRAAEPKVEPEVEPEVEPVVAPVVAPVVRTTKPIKEK
jgi:hypothetical protein